MAHPASFYFVTALQTRSPQKASFINLFYWDCLDTAPTTDFQIFVDNIAGDVQAQLAGSIADCLTVADHEVGSITTMWVAGVPWVSSQSSLIVGTVAGDQLPDYAAVVIQKRTATAGKSGRGRWYVGPVPEALTDENIVDPASIGAYQTLADSWNVQIVSGPTTLIPSLFSVKDNALRHLIAVRPLPALGTLRGRKFRSAI